MARSKIPSPIERRHLVEREIDAAKALRLAEAYLEGDRVVEALDFLRKAGESDRLAELRARAIADGDAFLLRAVAGAMDASPGPAEWRALAEAATAAGKDRYAEDASRQAERGED